MGRGRAHLSQQRPSDAAACFRKVLALAPSDAEALNDLGLAARSGAGQAASIRSYRRAIATSTRDPAPFNNLANALAASGNRIDASRAFDQLRQAAPWLAEGFHNSGDNSRHLGELDPARALLRAAIALKPGLAASQKSLAALLMSLGEMTPAIAAQRRVLSLAPSAFDHSDLIFMLGYDEATTNAQLFAETKRWAIRYGGPRSTSTKEPLRDAAPDRRLRVGYVSGDFCNHPVARSLVGLLARHDRTKIHVIAYAEVARHDFMTDRFERLVDDWRLTRGLSDDEVAGQIRRDRVDILVFVAGHTGENRLSLATRRAAPIQISMYAPTTTGLSQIDAWMTDDVLHPVDTTERFVEEQVRLPCLIPLEPPDAPLRAAPRRDHVVFASFNNPAKQTPAVYRLWARVLAATPHSTLRFKYRGVYRTRSLRERIIHLFRIEGIEANRLDFVLEMQDRGNHLADMANVDIALDAFPFNGCNTTFDLLWMGVPVVTMLGERFLARMSAGFLSRIGLSDLIAEDDAAYVGAAAALAADPTRRAGLRAQLRERLAASPLCDPDAYARSVEHAYRRLWRRRCGL